MSELMECDEPQNKKRKYEDVGEVDIKDNIDFTQDTTEVSNSFTINDKYSNIVSQDEVEKLKEFKVLDEVKSNDEDSNDEESNSSEDGSEGLPGEEIEKMLDEDLPEDFKGDPKPKEKPYIKRTKIVLEEKGVNHFEILPLDWMMIRHCSGIPIYMHRGTRVCTLSKPYFLGEGNTRRHDIPISSIPCLAYRRGLEEEKKQKEIDRRIAEQIKNGTWAQPDKNKSNVEKNSENAETNNSNNVEKDVAQKDSAEISSNSINDVELIDTENKEEGKVDENEKPKCPMRFIQSTADSSHTSNDKIENDKSSNEVTSTVTDLKEENILTNDINNGESSKDEEKEPSNQETEKEKTTESNEQSQEEVPVSQQPVVLPGGMVVPPPRVETVNMSWKSQHLTPEQVNDYCKTLFKFKYVNIMHFKRWADRRKYTKARKRLQCPTLAEGTKLVTIPAVNTGQDNGGRANKRDWVMNMNGRSYLSVFHEYVHRALQKELVYDFKQLENASMPYQATVFIDGMQYGVGLGSSKRQAKSAAAKASIQILIPEMKEFLEPNNSTDPDFTFFDYVGIEDPRIPELCSTACEPSPHAILRTCLLRNFGANDWHIHTEMKKLEFQKIELTMKVGKHEATVVCKNKKTAKQRAAQSILQALHPQVRSWGSLLRLYGSRSVKSCKEKKLEEQQITLLQDKARHNEPNYAVLDKLRQEMQRLRERDAAVVPIGTVLLPHALPVHSASGLNSVDL
ncbi:microprocessor complex subunit DGCR8 [Aricia agestis]|uniref:microprocessor complex subunit DGCR8 n=1 Tax=Aricia agestis TaxID=91739 RepID=UPI001C20AE6A|nr:microprocessor complex subunit DGCR8 [Aricia agestis]